MKTLDAVIGYIDILQKELGIDIIIYDESGLVRGSCLSKIAEVGKWHTNPYCLKIKENKRLRNFCVSCKADFVKKVMSGKGVVKSTCFCGVTEYVIPIKICDSLICMVSAIGYFGKLRDSSIEMLSRFLGLEYRELVKLREESLVSTYEEKTVITAIEILQYMLFKCILEETDIPNLIESNRYRMNEHIFKAIDFISSNFTKQIDANSVAAHCHVNVSYLQHLFSDVLGHGIAQEIKLRRLAFAEELICTTNYSVRYISFLSGFSSPDYFSTAYKKHFGISPLVRRKKNKITAKSKPQKNKHAVIKA